MSQSQAPTPDPQPEPLAESREAQGTEAYAPTLVPVEPAGAEAARLPAVEPDRYSIEGELAQGGIGRILRARDAKLGRAVALKEPLEPGGFAGARFVSEALVTARLQHPAIVPVYDAGRWPSGAPFYAMKLVSGRSLAEVLAEPRGLDRRLALLPHVLAVADAIAYAHSQRIIHRDLKPANVLVGEFGETVVIDWGLAKELGGGDGSALSAPAPGPAAEGAAPAGLTLTGSVVGTPTWQSVPH